MVLIREEPPKEVFNVPNPSRSPFSIVGRNTEQEVRDLAKHCDLGPKVDEAEEADHVKVSNHALPPADVDEVNMQFEKQHSKLKRQRIQVAAALDSQHALNKLATPCARVKGPPKPPPPPPEPKVQYAAPKETSALAALVAEKLGKTKAEKGQDILQQESLVSALSHSQSAPLLAGSSMASMPVTELEKRSPRFVKKIAFSACGRTGMDSNTWHGPSRKGPAAQIHQDLPWEQGPNPSTYRPRYDLVRDRRPDAMVTGRPKKSFFEPQTDVYRPHPNADSFLTECADRGIDPKSVDPSELNCRQRAMLGMNAPPPPKAVEPMRANSERGELGKVGRANVHFTQITAPAADRDEQDMKTRNLRYPHWNFGDGPPRPDLYKLGSDTDAGKYDVNYARVDKKIHAGAPMFSEPFGHALPYEKPECLGHCAPTANMHPEHKRGPGVCPDRSLAKDHHRPRMCHVNDFNKELARPPLLAMPTSYHDTSDPVACEKTYRHEMSFDKREFDWYCTTRRDAVHGPSMAKASMRGKVAVQGQRPNGPEALGTRAAVGLGTMARETLCALEKTQEQRDARTSKACRGQGGEYRFDTGNVGFDKQTSHPPAYSPVNVSPTKTFAKVAPLQGGRQQKCTAFRRTASEGFSKSCRTGTLGLPSKKKFAQGPSWYDAKSQEWSFEASVNDE